MSRARVVALAAALALAVAGCGEDDERAVPAQAPPEPTPTAEPAPPGALEDVEPRLRIPADVRRRLAAGEVAVLDLSNRAAIEPGAMRANRNQLLSDLEWSGWGTERATARGTVKTLTCEPNCSLGQVDEAEATLTLSAIRVCGARRFYTEGRLDTGGRRPAVYLRTPC